MDKFQKNACTLCVRRKVKCNKKLPCSYCTKHGEQCVPTASSSTPRKQKQSIKAIVSEPPPDTSTRISYEDSPQSSDLASIPTADGSTILSGTFPTSWANPNRAEPLAGCLELENVLADESLAALEVTEPRPCNIVSESLSYSESLLMGKWFSEVFREDAQSLLRFDDDCPGQTLDSPEPAQVFGLWRVYRERVNPVMKLIDIPMMQARILEFGDSISKASAVDQALILALFALSLSAMEPKEVTDLFNAEHHTSVLARYQRASQTALCRTDIWRSNLWEVLQALVIYLSSLPHFVDPHILAAYVGMADRMARRLAMHRQHSNNTGPKRFVTLQLQRQVWWELHILDRRCNEKIGAGSALLGDSTLIDLPSGAENDVSIPFQPRNPSNAVDEAMSFVMVKYEIASFNARLRAHQYPHLGCHEVITWAVPLHEKLCAITELERRLDANIFTPHSASRSDVSRAACVYGELETAKLRMLAYLSTSSASYELSVLDEALLQIKCDNNWRQIDRLQWFAIHHVPLLAYTLALRLVARLPPGKVAQRAWSIFQHVPWLSLGMVSFEKNAFVHLQPGASSSGLLGHLLLQAWDANNHHGFTEMSCISQIRARMKSLSKASISSSMNTSIGTSDETNCELALMSSGGIDVDMNMTFPANFSDEGWANWLSISSIDSFTTDSCMEETYNQNYVLT